MFVTKRCRFHRQFARLFRAGVISWRANGQHIVNNREGQMEARGPQIRTATLGVLDLYLSFLLSLVALRMV